MPKANPMAWVTGRSGSIAYKKVDKWVEYSSRFQPYFPTWKEAHDWTLAKAADRLKKAQAELKSATKHHAKVAAMKDPGAASPAPQVQEQGEKHV